MKRRLLLFFSLFLAAVVLCAVSLPARRQAVRPTLSRQVTAPPPAVPEDLSDLAEGVLEEIFTEDMSELDKVNAIYDYISGNMAYLNFSAKGSWTEAAQEGLRTLSGDCYVYACTAKLLLTEAGIPNMDISKSTSSGDHYWNLIDLGGGWYHFDATPRIDRPRIVLWNSKQLADYSLRHGNTHDYDPSLYPPIN